MKRVGITTTVPVEIIVAAGHIPVDLNNVFIGSDNCMTFVEQAENAGYPRNVCGWIKGLYAVCLQEPRVDAVVAVTQGDCSNTHALMETLQLQGVQIIPFAFPYDRDRDLLKLQMEKMMTALGTNWHDVLAVKRRLDRTRAKVHELDRLTWQDNVVSGLANHVWQVSCSDFNGDVERFECEVDAYLATVRQSTERNEDVRLGFIGVPPIISDLYSYIEGMGGRVVFNEVQRQFSMPFATEDIVEQYRLYTYPYGVFQRLEDIQREIDKRNLDGVIHYVQSFCYRQIEDMIFREKLDVPLLTIEGDTPCKVDARTKLRIDSFIEMLR